MQTYQFKNINQAFDRIATDAVEGNIELIQEQSRNGPVSRIPGVTVVEFQNPLQRALHNSNRDCNPFFHLFESMWMLAGRNDVEAVTKFVKTMANFSDDGKTFHGAYGYRWRNYFGYDQLNMIVEELKTNPGSRRCVLQMWDGGRTFMNALNDPTSSDYDPLEEIEPIEGTGDLYVATHGGKDVPCNISCTFSVTPRKFMDDKVKTDHLDMTVFNRSNDLIWGLLGANVVHFSFLLDWLSSQLNLKIGYQTHVSSNAHFYTKELYRKDVKEMIATDKNNRNMIDSYPYMVSDTIGDCSLEEIEEFVEFNCNWNESSKIWQNPFLRNTAQPMMDSFFNRKLGRKIEMESRLYNIQSDQWRYAAAIWLRNRGELV